MTRAIALNPSEGRQLHVLHDEVRVLASGDETAGEYEVFVVEGVEGSGPPPHFHPWDEAVYILEGEIEQTSQGDSRRLSEGCFALTPGGTVHSYRVATARARFLVLTAKAGAARFFADMDREIGGEPDFGKVVEVARRNQVEVAVPGG